MYDSIKIYVFRLDQTNSSFVLVIFSRPENIVSLKYFTDIMSYPVPPSEGN